MTLAAAVLCSHTVTAAPAASAAQVEVVAEVRVHGNYSVPDAEVFRLAGIAQGQVLDGGALQTIETRLRESGRFDSVQIRKRYRSFSNTEEVTLILVVRERAFQDTGNLLFKVAKTVATKSLVLPIIKFEEGYGFTYGARLSTVDLLGAGERVSVPLTWGGTKRAAIEGGKDFEEGRSSLGTGASVSRRENPHFGVDDDRLELWARVDRELVTGLRARLHAGWTDVTFSERNERFASYAGEISWDTRVDPTFPRNAVHATAGWGAISVRDGPTIHRPRFDARVYAGLLGQSVLSVRALFVGADRSVPDYERSLLGGGATLRGHPVGEFIGDKLAASSVELRLPLTSPVGFGKAGVNFFYDVGTAYDVGEKLSRAGFHQGTGLGFFLLAPPFQSKIEVAHNLVGRARVHFSLRLGL